MHVTKQDRIDALQEQITRLNTELENLSVPAVPDKKIDVEALPNGYLLGIKHEDFDSRVEVFLTHEEGKNLVKDLLLGCEDGLFILSPFSRDVGNILEDIGKAFNL